MAVVSLDDILSDIAPSVPGCPSATLRQALLDSAREFCDITHIWQYEFSDETTVAGEAEYGLSAPGEVSAVLTLACGGRSLGSINPRVVAPNRLAETAMPSGYWHVHDNVLRLYPTPDKSYPLNGLLALRPQRTATGVEAFLYDTYKDAIVSGALWRVLRVPNKEWSAHDLAERHLQLFAEGAHKARVRTYQTTHLRVRAQPF